MKNIEIVHYVLFHAAAACSILALGPANVCKCLQFKNIKLSKPQMDLKRVIYRPFRTLSKTQLFCESRNVPIQVLQCNPKQQL